MRREYMYRKVPRVIPYGPSVEKRLRNVASLPRGLRCPYLKCLGDANEGPLVAKSWHRKLPDHTEGETIVSFGR